MKQRLALFAALSLLCVAAIGSPAAAHHEQESDGSRADNKHLLHDSDLPDGHVPANTNYGYEAVGHTAFGLDVASGATSGLFTDVWAHEGYAYVGTFQEPSCTRAGVLIADVSDPTSPQPVGMIKSPPDTRVNDVKVHELADGTDVLIHSLEPCGPLVGANAHQLGQGGIALFDVTDPTKPVSLKRNFLDFPVHNTYAWTNAEGESYLMVVDDINLNDTHIVDITKPQSPKLITTTGIGDWLAQGLVDINDPQLFMRSFAASLLHDIWVDQVDVDGELRWVAVLSYWDHGFVTLDVTDPRNPVYLGDSDYPDPDPVLGVSPPEGNAHAAVFGGNDNEYIFGGDEDFDASFTAVQVGDQSFAATQGSDVPQITAEDGDVTGPTVFVGRACTPIDAAPSDDAIALIERGDCAFTTKAQNAEAAGYQAVIVFNQPSNERADGAGCETTISMLVEAGIPALFVPRSAGFAVLGIAYDPSLCTTAGDANPPLPAAGTVAPEPVTIGAVFDGWGYFHVLNNRTETVEVPDRSMGTTPTVDVDYLGEIGYYAPAEVADPTLATGAGDLTMHNLEKDPSDGDRSFIAWYSLGMRAVEWRPGHYHENLNDEGVFAWNVHEVGRWIADDEADAEFGTGDGTLVGSNFWGIHVTEIDGEQYILGSDRSTGLWVFQWNCEDVSSTLYCNAPTP
jgi:hypothetical protein